MNPSKMMTLVLGIALSAPALAGNGGVTGSGANSHPASDGYLNGNEACENCPALPIPAANGISFAQAKELYESAVTPTKQQLLGKWKNVMAVVDSAFLDSIADSPYNYTIGETPSGAKNQDGSDQFLVEFKIATNQSAFDPGIRSSFNYILHNLGRSGFNQGPYEAKFTGGSVCLAQYAYEQNTYAVVKETSAKYECRLVAGDTSKMICQLSLEGDWQPYADTTGPAVMNYIGVPTAYVGFKKAQ